MDYKIKYLIYKNKYLELKNLQHGGNSKVNLLNGSIVEITDELFDDMVSWILFSIREVIGYADIRKQIILHWLTEKNIINVNKEIITINPERKDDSEVVKLCTQIIGDTNPINNLFIFTGTNLPDPRTKETHYNIFIIDKSIKKLYIIDPASKLVKRGRSYIAKEGIYSPYLANDTIIPFFEKYRYTHTFIASQNAAQTNIGDVFCQSWTLLMLKLFLDNDNPQKEMIDIPKKQEKKYQLLLDFYKYILTNFPSIQPILNTQYQYNINTHRRRLTTKYNDDLLKINPSLTLLNHFIQSDMEE